MYEGALCQLCQTAQHGVVDVAQFDDRNGRSEAENALDEIEQRISEEECHTADEDVAITLQIESEDDLLQSRVVVKNIECCQLVEEDKEGSADSDDGSCAQDLRTLREFTQRIDSEEPCQDLYGDEDGVTMTRKRDNEHRNKVCHECRARIGENA